MSFYNVVFGQNPLADVVLATLDLNREGTGRFRDCFVAEGKIAVYTRNGGGNREEYQHVFDALAKHPCYLEDRDDDFDCTYATIYFKFPEQYGEFLTALDTGKFDPSQRWIDYLESMNKPGYVPPEAVTKLIQKLKETLESGKSGVIEV